MQYVPECMQNVPACSKMHADLWACMQVHELACNYISLHVQLLKLVCNYISLHAVPFIVWAAHKNFAVLVTEYLAFPFFPLLLDLWRPYRELRPFLDPLWQEPWWRKLIPCPHPSKQQDPFYFLPQPFSSLHRFKITGGKNGPDTKLFRERFTIKFKYFAFYKCSLVRIAPHVDNSFCDP